MSLEPECLGLLSLLETRGQYNIVALSSMRFRIRTYFGTVLLSCALLCGSSRHDRFRGWIHLTAAAVLRAMIETVSEATASCRCTKGTMWFDRAPPDQIHFGPAHGEHQNPHRLIQVDVSCIFGWEG